jgi:D-amino-acid dehydrogenase
MKVLIIGSGLLGLTTAYLLRRSGHQVTVLDREDGPGLGASFANGGLLTPSMPGPWNTPGCWRSLLSSIGRQDATMQLRLSALPGLARWGIGFLQNSTAARHQRNTLNNLRLALHSLRVMESIRGETGIDYGRIARGTLRLFRNPSAFERASAETRLSSEGLTFRSLSRTETVELEPALRPIESELAGAIHYPTDEAGDSYRFCQSLAKHAREQGVEFRFRTEVSALNVHHGQVTAVNGGAEHFVADRYVVAAGSYSTPLLRRAGIRLPVQPVKGYSVTFDRMQAKEPLGIPIVDDDLYAAVVPLWSGIRVAGTAEFAGYDLASNPPRARNLLRLLQRVLPEVSIDPALAKPWWGLRPVSADGVPIVGPTPVSNLWVNTGHGHLGWTMAAGSAQLLTSLMCRASPPLDPAPYALARFMATR